MDKLSVVIITHDEEHNVVRCIESAKSVADEIVVVDSNSVDRTVELCRSLGCRVIIHEFEGYGKQKQFAIDQANNNWVLSLDADEEVTDELSHEIKELLKNGNSETVGYFIPIALNYLGKILKRSTSLHLRLFNRQKGNFTQVPVHEEFVANGKTTKLKSKILHYSYRDISHHIQKIDHYTTQAAIRYQLKNKSFPKCWVFFKFPVTFFVYYFIRLGFLDGYPGFLWSFFAAFYGSLKIAKARELKTKQ